MYSMYKQKELFWMASGEKTVERIYESIITILRDNDTDEDVDIDNEIYTYTYSHIDMTMMT